MLHADEDIKPLAPLSERERVVALKWTEGLTYREIAETLFIAPTTVRAHLATIYKKLGIRNKTALIALLHQNNGIATTLAPSTALPIPACPYPGMVPFQADDAVYFYGRENEVQHLIQFVRQQRFLMVIGPSGSGKSSLIYAGLLPKLVQSRYFEPGYWLIRTLRPGSQPVQLLAEVLDCPDSGPLTNVTIQTLLAPHPPAQRLLLLVDQFEEIFTQASHNQRAGFITTLQALRTATNCALIVTLRADFYPDLMTSSLWPINNHQRLDIAPLRGNALRDAIEKPATAVGVSLEDNLVDQLLADAADEPGALPLLQETMELLWDGMEQRVLSYEAYNNLSAQAGQPNTPGLAVAMAMKADSILAGLSSEQHAIARRIFLRLIQFGEGRADTRRQQPVTALQSATDDVNVFERTLEHLTDHRLLTLSGDDDIAAPVVDISHESLINGWSRLQRWVTERREAEQVRRRLEGKAAEWVRLGQGTGGLLSDVELLEAEYWLASDDAADLGFDTSLPELVQASQP